VSILGYLLVQKPQVFLQILLIDIPCLGSEQNPAAFHPAQCSENAESSLHISAIAKHTPIVSAIQNTRQLSHVRIRKDDRCLLATPLKSLLTAVQNGSVFIEEFVDGSAKLCLYHASSVE